MLNYIVLLHLIMGILVSVIVINAYIKSGFKRIGFLVTFGSMGLYSFALSLPLLISPTNLSLAAWGYVVGISFIIVVFVWAVKTAPISIIGITNRWVTTLYSVLIIGGILSVILHIIGISDPTITVEGFVIWNANLQGAWILAILSMLIALVWSFSYYKSAGLLSNRGNRLKTYVLAFDGFAWAVAAVLYFPAQTELPIIGAFVLMIGSLLATSVIFLTLQFVRKTSIPE